MFTVGTRVRIVKTYNYESSDYDGKVGILEEIDPPDDPRPYKIRFADGYYQWAVSVEAYEAVHIPASVFDGTNVPFSSLREVFSILDKHGVKLDWTK